MVKSPSSVSDAPSTDDVHQAYLAAIRLLARRDHSLAELTFKLQQRGHGDDAIQAVLEELAVANHVDDERYAEYYAERCVNHGHGPLSILSRLEGRGIEGSIANRVVSRLRVDWCDLAETAITRRFTSAEILDSGQRATARIARFLQRRGFSPGDSVRALNRLRQALAESAPE